MEWLVLPRTYSKHNVKDIMDKIKGVIQNYCGKHHPKSTATICAYEKNTRTVTKNCVATALLLCQLIPKMSIALIHQRSGYLIGNFIIGTKF